jgi:putative DNA primase/helicase
MRRRGLSANALLAALLVTNENQCDPPLDEAEVCRIVMSVSRYAPSASLIPQVVSGEPMNTEHLTDLGNAKRLVTYHGQDLHYCYLWRKWLVWDETRWQGDETGEVMRRAKDTVAQIYREALQTENANLQKALLHHAAGSEAEPRLNALIALAASEPGIPILQGDLDTHHWLLNVENGTLDLRTGELRAPRREDLLTKLAPVTYDPDAPCPTWDAFLTRIMDGNQNLIRFLQLAVGYALTGDVREQVMLILWGTGRNGKSTFLNTLMAMLGPYAMKATAELLIARKGDRHPTERADLCGKRFVTAIETGEGQRLDEVFIKEATGGDSIRARRMREDFWEFWPTHTIFMATNHKPVIRGSDEGIWRRLRLVPFTVAIPEDEQNKTLPEELRAELAGILAWAVRGCLAWQQEGLPLPEEVSRATAAYREEMDSFGRFLAECCVQGPQLRTTTEELYHTFAAWCAESGEYQISRNYFSMRLRDRGLKEVRLGNRRGWEGIALVPTLEEQRQQVLAQLKAEVTMTPPPPKGEVK